MRCKRGAVHQKEMTQKKRNERGLIHRSHYFYANKNNGKHNDNEAGKFLISRGCLFIFHLKLLTKRTAHGGVKISCGLAGKFVCLDC